MPTKATRSFIRIFSLAACCWAAATSGRGAPAPLVLISLDGFRWDYCALHPAETPHLRRLKQEGISARELIPVYPSNTFPNHYSIVTGLYPEHHGIINNDMYDADLKATFQYNRAAPQHDPRWWGGEPIWITAVAQGKVSACDFWPGSVAVIKGLRPTYTREYDYSIPFATRLHDLIARLQLPEAQRPVITTFYLEETNGAGHKFGPDSPQVAAAVKLLDSRIGEIVQAAEAAAIPLNLIVVSDHGMTNVSPERWMFLEDYLDDSTVQVDFEVPVAGLRPLKGDAQSLVLKLANLPHARAYLAKDLPARFHIGDNPRTPPVWIVPEEGWHIGRRGLFNIASVHTMAGDHGFDNAFQSMHGILIAQGPAFKAGGAKIDPVENVNIYNLMCAVEGLKPASNDGDDRLVKAFLR